MRVTIRLTRLGRLSPSARRLIPALIAFAASAELFVFRVYAAPDRATADQMLALAARVRADDAVLATSLREAHKSAVQPVTTGSSARGRILETLDGIALQTGVRIIRVVPRSDAPTSLEVEMEARFPAFVRLAGEIEARRGTLRRILIQRRASATEATPVVAVTCLLNLPQADAEQLVPLDIAARLAAKSGELDPFGTLADRSSATVFAGHRLTGITMSGDELIATIDGRDYRLGEPFGTAEVTAIKDNAVQLSTGSTRYWLKFPTRRE